jgi:hypothetical protein
MSMMVSVATRLMEIDGACVEREEVYIGGEVDGYGMMICWELGRELGWMRWVDRTLHS